MDLPVAVYLASTLAGLCGQQLAKGRGRAVRIGLEDAANQQSGARAGFHLLHYAFPPPPE